MAEEQRIEQSNAAAPGLCANGCGFYGNPATLNLCSKCYRHHFLTEHRTKTASSSAIFSAPEVRVQGSGVSAAVSGGGTATETATATARETTSCGPSRCGACGKRVGLTGFRCRCGTMYCGTHRYPEQHSCTFDFKAKGKEAIAKANPVIKASKLDNKL